MAYKGTPRGWFRGRAWEILRVSRSARLFALVPFFFFSFAAMVNLLRRKSRVAGVFISPCRLLLVAREVLLGPGFISCAGDGELVIFARLKGFMMNLRGSVWKWTFLAVGMRRKKYSDYFTHDRLKAIPWKKVGWFVVLKVGFFCAMGRATAKLDHRAMTQRQVFFTIRLFTSYFTTNRKTRTPVGNKPWRHSYNALQDAMMP